MKIKTINIIAVVFLLSSIVINAQPKNIGKTELHEHNSTDGIILNVNPQDSSFLIKHTSRIIKFKASAKTVSEYKNKTNLKVHIFYQKLKDGTLFITEIKPAD